MDRFVVREPRTGADYPQGNHMIAFPANPATGNNMIPETMYFSGPFASEYPNNQLVNMPNMNAQHYNAHSNNNAQPNMNAQLNINNQGNMSAQLNMNDHHNLNANHNMNAQLNVSAQSNLNQQRKMTDNKNTYAQPHMNAQANINAQNNMYAVQRNISAVNNSPRNMIAQNHYGQQSTNVQPNMNTQLNVNAQSNLNAQPNMSAQVNMNAQSNINAQQRNIAQHNINARADMNVQMGQTFGQNSMLDSGAVSGIDPKYLAAYSDNSAQYIAPGQQIQRNTPINSFGSNYENRCFSGIDRNKQKSITLHGNSGPPMKKPNESDLARNDTQNQIVTRADKLKALHRCGPRVFSGPVEKVLKWHKSLQDIGVLILYEIVAKCVRVQTGKSCTKNLVIRDDGGPAMQVVYYEIDFLLPELKPPCTVRVIGRMIAGTCRLQAFNVRPATGDDVATLPRRAAVAAHHVAKLYKEYGPNAPHA